MYNGLHVPYPCLPYRHPYEICDPLPIPDVHAFAPPCHYDYPYRRVAPYIDYPYYDCAPRVLPRPPIVQTNVHNDVCYYVDDPYEIYDDEYGNPYRLSRSKVQLVDLKPKNRTRRNNNHMVVSTFQPRQREMEIPRPTIVRNTSEPAYGRQRRMRLMPLYHSAEPQYTVPNRRRSVVNFSKIFIILSQLLGISVDLKSTTLWRGLPVDSQFSRNTRRSALNRPQIDVDPELISSQLFQIINLKSTDSPVDKNSRLVVVWESTSNRSQF